jgi:hypothetical protein
MRSRGFKNENTRTAYRSFKRVEFQDDIWGARRELFSSATEGARPIYTAYQQSTSLPEKESTRMTTVPDEILVLTATGGSSARQRLVAMQAKIVRGGAVNVPYAE